MRSLVFILLGMACFLTLRGVVTPILAQEPAPLNITISPVTLILETKPGETQTATIKIRNNSPENEKLRIRLGTFTADQSGENPQLLELDPEAEFAKWLRVSETEFDLGSGEWKTIEVTFSPPQTAALSYYYTLYIERADPLPTLSGTTKVSGTAAVLILTTVASPSARRELQLESMTVDRPLIEFLPQEIKLTIRNTGNVHTAPTGNIFISGQGQQDLAVLPINPHHKMIIPGTTRTFHVPWDDGFPAWNAEEEKRDWSLGNIDHFRFGRYQAYAVMVYDNGERDVPSETNLTFWVVPWRLLGLVIGIPVLPALAVFTLMRWKYRHV